MPAGNLKKHAKCHTEGNADTCSDSHILSGNTNSRADGETEADRCWYTFVALVAHSKVLFARCFRMAGILLSALSEHQGESPRQQRHDMQFRAF